MGGAGGEATGGGGMGGMGGAMVDAGPGKMYTLTVTKSGSGKVTSTPVGDIDCGTTCTKMYTPGAMVVLTAVPDSMITFAGWGGDCNGTSTCSLAMSADHTVSASFKDCRPASLSAPQYVDHAMGTDDAGHGGSTGSCAYKTLSYALAHSTGSIALVATDTFPGGVTGESTPYALNGTQKLLCNNAKFVWPAGGDYTGLVSLTGTGNTVDGCRIDGATNGGYCAVISTAGSHTFSNNTVTNCGNVAINVSTGVTGIAFISNTFTANFNGINFSGTNGGTLTNNSMVDNNLDVYCATANAGLTGSGNTRGAGKINCAGCMNCASF
jgi:hypothetical protein